MPLLPDLGVGLVCLPGLEPLIESIGLDCDVLEVEPQTFWMNTHREDVRSFQLIDSAIDRLRALGRPLLVHSVGYPVGGSAPGDPRQLEALHETLARVTPAWWSEHVSFLATGCGLQRQHLGFLMPPVQSDENITLIVDRIKLLQDRFGLPFAFETGVNYLQPLKGELPDGVFWAEIAARADCGILLDFHNVWTNERNGRELVDNVVGDLPLDRIWEIHLAGGQQYKGYWLDAHSGLPPPELLDCVRRLVPWFPSLRAVVLEIIPDYVTAADITPQDLIHCVTAMRAIWASRGTARRGESRPKIGFGRSVPRTALPSPANWEEGLRRAVTTEGSTGLESFANDPAIQIYRDLISMVRRGMIADALPLSTRYLLLSLGEARFEEELTAFWRLTSPEPFMSDEALNFAHYLTARGVPPHIGEVIAFELAAHRAAMTNEVQHVTFTCNPEPLLEALRRAKLPGQLCAAETAVEVWPPSRDLQHPYCA